MLSIVCLFAFNLGFTQEEYNPRSKCGNYNSFLSAPTIENLKSLVDTVYPNGTIYFDPSKLDVSGKLELLYPLLDLDEKTTFELAKETKSRLNEDKLFRRYQQYYDGILVEGGGFTTAYYIPSGPPVDPCLEAYMMTPYLLSEIDLQLETLIPKSSLDGILVKGKVKSAELVISNHISGNCEYNLCWKVEYFEGGNRTAWIDAYTGVVLKSINSNLFKNAPTEDYGIQNMADNNVGQETRLETPDGTIRTYDFAGANLYLIDTDDFDDNLIPTSNVANDWQLANAPANVYQAHYVTTIAAGFFEGIGIDFQLLHVGANCTNIWLGAEAPNAGALQGSTLEEGFIVIGNSAGSTLAEFDIIGHELGHVFLNEFLDYDEGGNASLHEGIADMLGVYIEFMQTGAPSWEMGEDVPFIVRDLENPEFDCFDQVAGFMFNQRHRRSTPLGHWFYLISTGDPAQGVPSLGIANSLLIVLEALNHIGRDSDYGDLMNATMTVVEEEFGRCSNEFLAVANGWEAICVETGFAGANGLVAACSYTVSGPSWVCEESEYAAFCVQGGLPNAHYRFTIIGRKSTEFQSVCGMQGNSQEGCNCLTLIDFPKYPYYPQFLKIQVYSPTVGSAFIVTRNLKLVDCNGDDPTCDEYYSLHDDEKDGEVRTLATQAFTADRNEKYLRIYDLMGNLLYSGPPQTDIMNLVPGSQILVCVYFDQKGDHVRTTKEFILK